MKLFRHREASNLRWNSLPQHLMDVILDSAEAMGGKKCIARIRLVSKSWLAAVRAHPMKLKHMRVMTARDLVTLCGIIPHMAGLDFTYKAGPTESPDLSPLSAQSSLTHLSISRCDSTSPKLILLTDASLSCLPSSLKSLVLGNTCVLPENLGSLKFVRLRSLTLSPASKAPTTQKLLNCLPDLEVSHMLLPGLP